MPNCELCNKICTEVFDKHVIPFILPVISRYCKVAVIRHGNYNQKYALHIYYSDRHSSPSMKMGTYIMEDPRRHFPPGAPTYVVWHSSFNAVEANNSAKCSTAQPHMRDLVESCWVMRGAPCRDCEMVNKVAISYCDAQYGAHFRTQFERDCVCTSVRPLFALSSKYDDGLKKSP